MSCVSVAKSGSCPVKRLSWTSLDVLWIGYTMDVLWRWMSFEWCLYHSEASHTHKAHHDKSHTHTSHTRHTHTSHTHVTHTRHTHTRHTGIVVTSYHQFLVEWFHPCEYSLQCHYQRHVSKMSPQEASQTRKMIQTLTQIWDNINFAKINKTKRRVYKYVSTVHKNIWKK